MPIVSGLRYAAALMCGAALSGTANVQGVQAEAGSDSDDIVVTAQAVRIGPEGPCLDHRPFGQGPEGACGVKLSKRF